jgi:hypothetical protein
LLKLKARKNNALPAVLILILHKRFYFIPVMKGYFLGGHGGLLVFCFELTSGKRLFFFKAGNKVVIDIFFSCTTKKYFNEISAK